MNAIDRIAKLHPETGGLGGDCCSGCGMLAPCPTRILCDEVTAEIKYAVDRTNDIITNSVRSHSERWDAEADRDRWKADAERLAEALRRVPWCNCGKCFGSNVAHTALAAHDALTAETGEQ